nr:CcdB family protein [uncultured Undibacterium sp.]
MAQFSVYFNKNAQTKKIYPFLLEIQSNLLSDLLTTVVVPLIKFDVNKTKILKGLTPVFLLDQQDYLMLTPQLAGIQRKELGKLAFDLAHARLEIVGALDFLISGV